MLLFLLLSCLVDNRLVVIPPVVEPPQLIEDQFTQQGLYEDLHINFFVDRSCSMGPEDMARVGTAAIQVLLDIDQSTPNWSLLFTTTDPNFPVVIGQDVNGDRSTPFTRPPEGLTIATAIDMAYASMYLPRAGGEAGFDSIVKFHYQAPDTTPVLHIVISDEDDDSWQYGPEAFANWFLNQSRTGPTDVVFVGATNACDPPESYMKAADLIGSRAINFCTNWEANLSTTTPLTQLKTEFVLSADPTIDSLQVFLDEVQDDTWSLDGRVLSWTIPPASSTVIVAKYYPR